jgi:anti-sigma regulatory factor (Ser/Thr protein kinase)
VGTIELSIPPKSVYVGVVRLAVSSLARTAGMGEEAVDDLKIAVSEACTNAVESNSEAGLQDPVVVTWTEEPNRVLVQIADRGTPVTTSDEVVDTQGFSTRHTMSLALLESLADAFKLTPRDGGGLCTSLAFDLNEAS